MPIDDDDIRREFMEQFLETAEERLGACRKLLPLTQEGAEGGRVEMVRARAEILRELHAFKGEARMMGSEDVGGATEMAELFLKRRNVPLEPVAQRLLSRTFDAVEKLVAFHAGRIERSPKTELNALLRLLARPPEDETKEKEDSGVTNRTAKVSSAKRTDSDMADATRDANAVPMLRRMEERRGEVPVLLVDDSDIVRQMTLSALEAAGYPARGVATLDEALAAIREQRPAVVLCDYHLDGATGEDVCHALHGDADTAGIPVVLFSGSPEEELAELTERAGAAGYLPKPDDLDAWLKQLDAMADRFVPFR